MADRHGRLLNQQAENLFLRGTAAARAGQKTIAATLLRQAVKLDPQHEQAWLWLSGVLDKPEDVAFCLRAVLGINPHNDRARNGLGWIERQTSTDNRSTQHPAIAPQLMPASDSWWTRWRQQQSTWLWTLRALLLIPIILLSGTLGTRLLIQIQPLPTFVTYHDIPVPTPAPTDVVLATSAPSAAPIVTERAVATIYMDQINVERSALQQATEAYRAATDGSATNVQRATATKQFREQIQQSRERIAAITVPPEAQSAHAQYVEGLQWELEALDQMSAFYADFNIAQSNRAALRIQDARAKIATATALWDAFAQHHGLTQPAAGRSDP